jgi:glucose-6-phosphate isomerase
VLEGGLSQDSLATIEPELQAAQRELLQRRGQDVGFLDLPLATDLGKTLLTEAKRLRALADDLLVLGIGGSSLGGQTLASALHSKNDLNVRVHFLDNIDPDHVSDLLGALDPHRSAVVVISKSGATVETLAQFLVVRRWFRASVGQGESRARTVFVTDPTAGWFREIAGSEGIRAFDIAPNVCGRYSVLSAAGLLPAAFLGIDIDKLCRGAAEMVQAVTVAPSEVLNQPAGRFAAAALLAERALGRRILVMMPYSDALRRLAHWFVQLWAESLGKRFDRNGNEVRVGQTPIAAVGTSDQHAQLQLFIDGPRDKVVVLLTAKTSNRSLVIPDEYADQPQVSFLHKHDLSTVFAAQRRATRAALLEAGVPVIDVELPQIDEAAVGGLLVLFEAAAATAGLMLNIDPFSQPGVQAQRQMALGLLGHDEHLGAVARVLARESEPPAQ